MAQISDRFRGFLPVALDVETGGFNPETDALLEVAICMIEMDEKGQFYPGETISCHVEPFPGSQLNPKSLEVNGIDPFHPFREAKPELDALREISRPIRRAVKAHRCQRAIMVAHNPMFDLSFLNATIKRTGYKRSPFHPFSAFDTATLAGLAYGQTVLARAVQASGLSWRQEDAHSAGYDAERTASLFCRIVNRWDEMDSFNFASQHL
ncbi:MAG: ribonuclease T [Xanthomonadales bacterium]|jgi:ribonuclease T|nr:ribonuclease T [Xanthomonadales bacterium]